MNESKLFQRTRWQLAIWYAGVMGAILSLSSFGVYEAIDHAQRLSTDRELQSVAGRLHDDLELALAALFWKTFRYRFATLAGSLC